MLRPTEDRLDYGNIMRPPVGYTCEFAVGTSYSLDLEALLGVPLTLFLTEEMDGALHQNPVYVLEGLRQSANKFVLFCEGGQIKVPNKASPIFALLEDSIFEVAQKDDKSFHPKVWIVKYTDSNKQDIYRVIVMSRNLTFDRSWDIAVVLEGKKTGRKTSKNQPLVDFISFLQSYTPHTKKKKQMDRFKDELMYVHFSTEDKHYTDFDFLPLGIAESHDQQSTGIFEKYHELLVFSPFLSKQTVMDLNELALSNSQKTLITRRTEASKLTDGLLQDFDCYCLKDTILDGEEAISDPGSAPEYQRQDIHGKLYFKRKYNEHVLYLGSANCSTNAFHGNVEFMLRLNFQKRGFRISHVIDELFCRTGKDDDERKNPFEKIEVIPEVNETEKSAEDTMQRAIKALCRSRSKASVTENEHAYDIAIEFDKRFISNKVLLTVSSLAGGPAAPVSNKVILPRLSLLQISEFYTVKAQLENTSMERVIKIRTDGIPEERDSAIIKSVIRDRATFLQYVSFLLSDDYLLAALEQLESKPGAYTDWNLHAYELPVLYENMLKAAARSPEKLKDIEDMIKRINDEEIIPPGFHKLYETFRKASRKKGKL